MFKMPIMPPKSLDVDVKWLFKFVQLAIFKLQPLKILPLRSNLCHGLSDLTDPSSSPN